MGIYETLSQVSVGKGSGAGEILSSNDDEITSSNIDPVIRNAVGTYAHTKSPGSPMR